MGQYHGAYNLTKKEYIGPHALCSGAKLMEWGMGDGYMGMALALLLSNSNGRGGGDLYIDKDYDDKSYKSLPLTGYKAELQGLIDALSGRWAGDKIVVQGDYAKKGDPGFISEKAFEEGYTCISDPAMQALLADKWIREEVINSDGYFERSVKEQAERMERLSKVKPKPKPKKAPAKKKAVKKAVKKTSQKKTATKTVNMFSKKFKKKGNK